MIAESLVEVRAHFVARVRRNLVRVRENDGLRFRNDMETGPGGKQIQLEDPDGNPIELFEPARRA